jgi:hypothetical protein
MPIQAPFLRPRTGSLSAIAISQQLMPERDAGDLEE